MYKILRMMFIVVCITLITPAAQHHEQIINDIEVKKVKVECRHDLSKRNDILEEAVIQPLTKFVLTEESPIQKKYTDSEVELLSLVMMGEAEGESDYGKRLVIDTVLNRVDSEHFPNTIYDVIYQKNQFSAMWGSRLSRTFVTDDARQLVREELENRTNYEVIFFTAGDYGRYGEPLFQEGNHYFCRYE